MYFQVCEHALKLQQIVTCMYVASYNYILVTVNVLTLTLIMFTFVKFFLIKFHVYKSSTQYYMRTCDAH